jgi:hypothetical protein
MDYAGWRILLAMELFAYFSGTFLPTRFTGTLNLWIFAYYFGILARPWRKA